MTDYALETQNLRKVFGQKVAVEDLTLQVKKGEVFGFLGPNGAGKTTSVKMLLNLITPTSGSGQLLQRPLGDTEARRRVGYLPEHFRFYEWLTASEFLDLNGRLFGIDRNRRQQIIPDLLTLVGLENRFETRLKAFSKGMLQRIGLAQAMMNDPELVVLDEPTSGLDPLGRRLVRDIIDGLRAEGTAVFINSHLLSEIEKTCDRVAFIRKGSVLEISHMAAYQREDMQVTIRVGQPTQSLVTDLAQFGRNIHKPNGQHAIEMTISSEEVVPQIAHWLIDNGHTIYELHPHRTTLEERFVEIIGEESGDS